MNFITDMLIGLSRVMKPYTDEIAFAVAATLLIIYGNDINKGVKKSLKHHPFVMRVLLFILVASIGYGFVAVVITKGMARFFGTLDNRVLGAFIICMFIGMGILAERKGHI